MFFKHVLKPYHTQKRNKMHHCMRVFCPDNEVMMVSKLRMDRILWMTPCPAVHPGGRGLRDVHHPDVERFGPVHAQGERQLDVGRAAGSGYEDRVTRGPDFGEDLVQVRPQ